MIEYWTASPCFECGTNETMLTYARQSNVKVIIHLVRVQPDPIALKAAGLKIDLPFFTDAAHTRFWKYPADYVRDMHTIDRIVHKSVEGDGG